ncbi:hypothetical protein DSO57_1035978 [Entomophthora muscae]|uniref:Uncharacterized protein n=1 Tax=Entomophthora muscae TaxID=34485 RepID=A0ACC2S1I3_9FUNG|nr:hypothetical protein DSO57_1035978 [Entomophthora muscae]
MTPLLTLQPDFQQESVATNKSTSTQIFGVMYITLTGLIDSMVPASGPWALLGKLLSYFLKLPPILWWALPSGPAGFLPTSSQEHPAGWIPDTTVATKVQTLPANISYNTQGALDELPLDVSNVMNESDVNVKWRALHPN